MATRADYPALAPQAGAHGAARTLNPSLVFWIAGLLLYGGAATRFATGHFLDQIPRDLWQHLAALRALIEDPLNPINPFVPTDDVSRHFHPYWVTVAYLARALGWNEWQAVVFAGFVSAGVLLAGIYAFGRVFYRSPWGPLALLAAMAFGWLIPVSHTGYHSMGTLIEGIAYPAVLLMGLSFLLWAAVIRLLREPRWAFVVAPLVALMVATHQLGAGIGLIVASCLIAFSPQARLPRRALAAAAIAAGLILAHPWPYFSPYEAIRSTGNPVWVGGVSYYSPFQLFAALVPQAVGLVGLLHPHFRRRARPVLIAFCALMLLFACGLFGIMIATRFLMPAVLLLHIGMGALFIALGRGWPFYSKVIQLSLFGAALLVLNLFLHLTFHYLKREHLEFGRKGNVYAAAVELTADVPDMQPIAAYDVAAWPVVATGQRASSVPWPEPGIPDLADRQNRTDALFDPALTRAERVALARQMGVRTLIMDEGGPLRRPIPKGLLQALSQQSVRQERSGRLLRFDLY